MLIPIIHQITQWSKGSFLTLCKFIRGKSVEKKHEIIIELQWNGVVASKNVVYTIIKLLDIACNAWQCFSRYHIKLLVYNVGQLTKRTKNSKSQANKEINSAAKASCNLNI